MKYRLDADHHVNNVLLPEGTIVGDGEAENWRYPESAGDPRIRGKHRPPSNQMTPLDEEAKKAFADAFPSETPPDRDPTQAIPISTVTRDAAGNEIAPPGQPNAAPKNPTEKARTGVDVTKDSSLAEEDPTLNRTPTQHKPEESKPAGAKPADKK